MAKRRAAMYQEAIDAVVAAAVADTSSSNSPAATAPTTTQPNNNNNVSSTNTTTNNATASSSSSSSGSQLFAPLTPFQHVLTPQFNPAPSTTSTLTKPPPASYSSAPSTFTSSSTNSNYLGNPYPYTFATNTNNSNNNNAPATATAPPPSSSPLNLTKKSRKTPTPRAPLSSTAAVRGRGGRGPSVQFVLPAATGVVYYNPTSAKSQLPAPVNLSTLDPKYYVGSGPIPTSQQQSVTLSVSGADLALIPKGGPYLITASPPTPPDWATSLKASIQSLASPYHRTPVDPTSIEHQVLSDLILPAVPGLKLNSIDRIVNPSLWSKFIAMRKEMLCSKTDDLALLASFGLSGDEIQQRAHVALNYTKDPTVFGPANQYSDNMVLLFHCTKTGNLDSILSQGLDERVGSGGLLGRGIYFADNPAKSIYYDANNTLLVFAVLLGDCLCVDSLVTKGSLVREPEKTPAQRRNHLDLFFDSIVGRPGGYNEYVIYNRSQCVPLYSVGYTKQSLSGRIPMDYYSTSRSCIPIFAWSTNINVVQEYYQYAQHVFRLMGIIQEDDHQGIEADTGAGGATKEVDDAGVDNGGAAQLEKHLNYLFDIGFMDIVLNTALLEANGYNLQVTIDQLLDTSTSTVAGDDGNEGASMGSNMAMASTSTASKQQTKHGNNGTGIGMGDVIDLTADDSFSDMDQSDNHNTTGASSTINDAGTAIRPVSVPTRDDCAICFNDYDCDSTIDWKILNCTHKICSSCYTQIQSSGTTMSGALHTYIKCPFCGACTGGAEIGSCPNGSMTHSICPSQTCAGYESTSAGVIIINYSVPPWSSDGLDGLNRSAYLPNNPEGQHVLGLLQVAWDRRLIFSIGTSLTTGANNVLVWNIHHKTATSGDVGSHGYPDPTYLSRVQLELAQYGIQ